LRINAFFAEDPSLSKHRFSVLNLLRQAPHTLDAQGESVLALASQPLSGPDQIRNQLVLSDIPWPLKLSTGETRIDNQGCPHRPAARRVASKFFPVVNLGNARQTDPR